MPEDSPMIFTPKSSTKAMYAFLIAFSVLMISGSVYFLIRETGKPSEIILFALITAFMLPLLMYSLWSLLYAPSTLRFYNDYVSGESLLGHPLQMYYKDIEAIDRIGIQFGEAFKLRTGNRSLELSYLYKNHDRMYEILEKRIRPEVERKCMDKFSKGHTFTCQNPAFLRMMFRVSIFIVSIIPALFSIYMISVTADPVIRKSYLPAPFFLAGFGLFLAILGRRVYTKYFVSINGIEVKGRFSSQKYQWEEFTNMEYRYMMNRAVNVMAVYLQASGGQKIGIGAAMHNFEALCLMAEAKIQHDSMVKARQHDKKRMETEHERLQMIRRLALPLVCLVLPIPLLYMGLPVCMEEYKLDHSGLTASGHVTAKEKVSDNWYFAYEFSVDGKTYQGRKLVRHKHYDDFKKDSSIEIEYLASDPAVNRPKRIAVRQSRLYYLFAILLFLFTAVVFLQMFRIKKKVNQRMREAQQGNEHDG